MTNSRLIRCHARVFPSPDQNGKSLPDRSKLLGSHGQTPLVWRLLSTSRIQEIASGHSQRNTFSESEALLGWEGPVKQVSSVALFTIRLPGQPFELSHPPSNFGSRLGR